MWVPVKSTAITTGTSGAIHMALTVVTVLQNGMMCILHTKKLDQGRIN